MDSRVGSMGSSRFEIVESHPASAKDKARTIAIFLILAP